MTRQEKIAQFERMLRRAPEIMSPMKAARFSPFGKNKVYELIKKKELKAYKIVQKCEKHIDLMQNFYTRNEK